MPLSHLCPGQHRRLDSGFLEDDGGGEHPFFLAAALGGQRGGTARLPEAT